MAARSSADNNEDALPLVRPTDFSAAFRGLMMYILRLDYAKSRDTFGSYHVPAEASKWRSGESASSAMRNGSGPCGRGHVRRPASHCPLPATLLSDAAHSFELRL